ncbi:type IV pilin protein [Pseudoduganella armeniaca]|uniref:Pilus assembly protein PilE n=1 Tax=Pseudoduganella armeniaca TaxID=2072590 RepID=A0A2R4CHR2_9BURK|nr:type IV pilin protein [Pseudoduganella armeniaca]AVR99135.1 pilus assembly protein PilE [Pseudoduganella armeniaca]
MSAAAERRVTRQRAFTLTEVLVALAVCGIVGAVALPTYQEQLVRARRTEAQAALQRLMQQQERYFTLHNRYVAFGPDSTDDDARQFRWWSGTRPERSAYEIAGRACDDRPLEECVQLVATPGTRRVDVHFRDASCGQLILTSLGERRASGTDPRCWR